MGLATFHSFRPRLITYTRPPNKTPVAMKTEEAEPFVNASVTRREAIERIDTTAAGLKTPGPPTASSSFSRSSFVRLMIRGVHKSLNASTLPRAAKAESRHGFGTHWTTRPESRPRGGPSDRWSQKPLTGDFVLAGT